MWSRDHIGCGPKGNPASSVWELLPKSKIWTVPQLRLPEALIFLRFRVFLFLAKVPVFSGLQPPGLQRGGKAPCGELENTTSVNFRKLPVFSSGNFAGLKNVGGFRLSL